MQADLGNNFNHNNSIECSAYLRFPVAGTITIRTQADDGNEAYINGVLQTQHVIDVSGVDYGYLTHFITPEYGFRYISTFNIEVNQNEVIHFISRFTNWDTQCGGV